MDLIYTNKNKEDVGILLDYDFDLAFGSGENDFELKVALDNHCCSDGCLVYIEGTEYGGIIDKVKIVTKSSEITYKGRTWHGILASKVIEPLKATDESSGGVVVHKGGKNFLKVTAKTQTVDGVTFTVNENGSIVGSGSASAILHDPIICDVTLQQGEKYILSGAVGWNRRLILYYKADHTKLNAEDRGQGVEITVPITGVYRLYIWTGSGESYNNNETFYPMLRVASDTSATFKPYDSLEDEYLMISGEANKCIQWLLERSGLADLFTASEEDSGLSIVGYKMNRYVDAYTGIKKMLASADGKLQITFQNGKVVLSALPLVDYSTDEEYDNDQVEMEIEKAYAPINHLICLGGGQLADRLVLHLYTDEQGKISPTQSLKGVDEVTDVLDYPNCESAEELEAEGKERLKASASSDSVKMSFDADESTYDIGDIVGAREIITGIAVAKAITKKIVSINKGKISIQYKVGE